MKIIAVYQNPLGATSFYRGNGVLNSMCRRHGWDISSPEHLSWSDLIDTDILYLERPHAPHHSSLIAHAKKLGVKIWVDWDDEPFHIPLSNPCFPAFSPREVREEIIDIMARADAVSVSTEALAEIVRSVRADKSAFVIPNAWDVEKFPVGRKPRDQKKVLWRGSDTHAEDIETVETQYREAIIRHKDVYFHFMGHLPHRVCRSTRVQPLANVRFAPTSDMVSYIYKLRNLSPTIMVVPLYDDIFNRCKSNIAWLEATMAGAVVLAPALPEFVRPGIVNYETPSEFAEALDSLIAASDSDLNEKWESSRKWIMEHETAESANQKRTELIRTLAK